MTSRKQTPDVLGEILGGEPSAPQPAPAPKPKRASTRKPSTRKTSRRSRAKRPQWEYMEVVFHDYGGYRPRFVNGEEIAGWKESPLIHEYLNQMGKEGWELAGVGSRHKNEMPAYLKRPKT